MSSVIGLYFRTRRVRVAALVYFLASGLTAQLPLFNYLGYEFSAAMTVPVALVSGILTILFAREHLQKPLQRKTWLFVIVDYLHINFLLLLIPLLVITVNALVVKNCAYGKGMSMYLLLPMVTMFFSVSLALLVTTLFRRAMLVYLTVIGLLLAHIIVVTYASPQLFAYNPILGYFPGITYDETVGDLPTLMVFRELTVVCAIGLIAAFFIIVPTWDRNASFSYNVRHLRRPSGSDLVLRWCLVGCASVIALGWYYRAPLNLEYSAADIQQALGRRTESPHFIIYYAKRDFTISEIQKLRAVAEYHYAKVAQALQLHHPAKEKIEVYLYPDGTEKRTFIGTSNTNIAKPWKRQIHLTAGSFQSTFRHELVHVLAAEFGFPVVHASLRMAMNEGLAVAVDWEEGLFTPHQYAAALDRENGLANAASLFTYTGFAVESSTYAYLVAGSFCRYLIDRFGIERFKTAFYNGNFMFAFGESIDHLINEWRFFLRSEDISGLPPATVQALFFQPSIFYKTCAREVAEKNRIAVEAVKDQQYQVAEEAFERSYHDAPSAFAFRGILQCLVSQQDYAQVQDRFASLPARSAMRHSPSILLTVGDALYLRGDRERARRFYDTVAGMKYNASFLEASLVRTQMMKDLLPDDVFFKLHYAGLPDSAQRRVLRDAMARQGPSSSTMLVSAVLDERAGDDSLALAEYTRMNEYPLDGTLRYFILMHSARLRFRMNDFERAKMALWEALNVAPTRATSEYLLERIELCESVEEQLHDQ